MLQEPTREELAERLVFMEKRYNGIIKHMEERHKEDVENIMKHIHDDPTVNCLECGQSIFLEPTTYWDVTDTDIRCQNCRALLTITLENGQLKKSSLKEAGKSK